MERTDIPPMRVVGMFKGAIRVVENLFGKDPHRCGYFVCDVDRDVLEAGPVPGRLLLQRDAACFPEEVVKGAERLVVVAVLEGEEAGPCAKALARMVREAREAGIHVHGVISLPLAEAARHEAQPHVQTMVAEGWNDSYFQVICPHRIANGFRYRPGEEEMRRRTEADVTSEAGKLIDAQLKVEARFAPVLRKLDELIEALSTDDGRSSISDDEQPIKTD